MVKKECYHEEDWGSMKMAVKQLTNDITEIKSDVKDIKQSLIILPETYVTRSEYNKDRDKQDLAQLKSNEIKYDVKKAVLQYVISGLVMALFVLLILGIKSWLLG